MEYTKMDISDRGNSCCQEIIICTNSLATSLQLIPSKKELHLFYQISLS